jgi:diguanylate cyclase (GGDEF)-like protein
MTGIYNRRKFFDLTNLLFKESNENFFLATIDIDYFKRVNDNFGHDAGDYVIKRITEIISDLLPQNSIFARMGGEEFTVVLTQENDPEKANFFVGTHAECLEIVAKNKAMIEGQEQSK